MTRRRSLLAPLLLMAALVGTWQLASSVGILHPLIVPSPWDIIAAIPAVLETPRLGSHLAITAAEVAAGFAVSVAAGFSFGICVTMSPFARSALAPILVALQAPPKIVFVPIFLTWFGFGMSSKIVMASVVAFFPMFVNTWAGLASPDRDMERLFQSEQASRAQELFLLRIPSAASYIFAGLKLSWSLAVIGVIVAEFVGSQGGLGFLIQTLNFRLSIAEVFVVIGVLALGTLAIHLAIESLEKHVVFWKNGNER